MVTSETVKAKEDAERIAKRLNEIKQSYEQRVSKSQLRHSYDIPVNRSTKVWLFLDEMGFPVEARCIVIPQSKQKEEEQKQAQQKQSENKEENELEVILDD